MTVVLVPSSLAVPAGKYRGPRLQAALEALVGRLLEGRIQAGVVSGVWGEDAVILGYYQPYRKAGIAVRRRITGGRETVVGPDSSYVGLVFASESLLEVVDVGSRLSRCLGGGVWGATRIGPSRLGAGVVEVAGDIRGERVVECVESVFGRSLEVWEVDVSEQVSRITRAYTHPGWARYSGASVMPRSYRVDRGDYWVRVGLSLYEERFIAEARIDGVFFAAPPNEPYTVMSNLQGMPLGDQVVMALEVRLDKIELYGVGKDDVMEAFLRAAGLEDG